MLVVGGQVERATGPRPGRAMPRTPRATVTLILGTEKGRDGGLNPSNSINQSDVCVNGMALTYTAYFGADEQQLVSIVDFLLRWQLPDGGFNCRANRSGARHSSVHTTVSVIEGITEYQRSGYRYRLDHLVTARAEAAEFLLRHRMHRGERSGEAIHPEFTRLHHPARWHYDILRGLDAPARPGVTYDDRLDDALSLLTSRRHADGRWRATRAYPGATHVPPDKSGQPSQWITLMATRVLDAYADSR
ncbi:hypothetical protein [Actinoplanes sp. NPDC049599]|uniref:hypothetical protein n=1 Tax=Actinoplanes sp. NPDC049599 TaxID=3363903 RepID=UPI00379D4570